ncbi:hypothetical protein ElyMa_006650700 [Elysia marginata]|uniref:Uncharacterized protein n=1 Tax=Elysia marginata TaxID=1093978 RepID=A0AAV4IQ44_9GAST|nr:hypothetical protein ElyMa_006650700 [Elysia marginata]
MSVAFDTIDRKPPLDILKNIIAEDQLTIIRFLLSNTTIDPKIDGAIENSRSQTGGQYDPYCSIGWSLVGLGLPPRGSPGAAVVGLTTCVPLLGSVVGGAPRV